MERVLLALGSNLGDRLGNLQAAVDGLSGIVEIDAVSPVYETVPMYDIDQGAFLNMALTGRTGLEPRPLMEALKAVEDRIGRTPTRRNGPRAIDLDIIFLGSWTLHEPGLDIPHPRLAERAFVLAPAADIAADWRHPETGLTVHEMLDALGSAEIGVRLPAGVELPGRTSS